jgi:hypothetical protein
MSNLTAYRLGHYSASENDIDIKPLLKVGHELETGQLEGATYDLGFPCGPNQSLYLRANNVEYEETLGGNRPHDFYK